MRAAIFDSFGGPITIEQVGDPTPPADGAVIQVGATGVCRSDWHGWAGHDPSISLPHVPGHEFSGTVVAVGADVERTRIGQRVTLPFVLGCGRCAMCRSGDQHVCENQYQPGFDGWGSFSEFVAVPYADGNLVPLPPDMTFATAAGLGCRFATAFRAVVDQGAVVDGTQVAIWGCGGVGLSAVMIAAALGAEVWALDIDDEALRIASTFGAAHTVDAADPDLAVREIRSSGGGVDVSLDALGSTQTSIASMRSLRRRGRHIQVGLMVGDDLAPPIPMWRLHALEIELYGSHGMQAWRYPDMLAMVSDGRLAPDRLVTETVDLDGGIAHLREMASFPGSGFVVIDDFAG